MDLCKDEAWLREAARIEDETGGQVEAGLAMREYSRAVNALTPEQSTRIRKHVLQEQKRRQLERGGFSRRIWLLWSGAD